MSNVTASLSALAAAQAAVSTRTGAAVWPARFHLWWQRARSRQALSDLDGHLLADAGLSEGARRGECGKWFWQD